MSYIMANFSFGEERIGPTCVMFYICICMIELNLKNKSKQLEINSNQKITTCNATPNSIGRNFLIRDRNSAFYPPLERLKNSIGFWYSRFP
jgi:hypothetical protein